MADLFISGINQKLLDKFTNRLNKLRAGGAKKGDKSKYAIQAIERWLDNTIPKDRGHLLLQKEIDELKAENLRLNSAENPDYQTLRTENLELAKENFDLREELKRLLNENVGLVTDNSAQKNEIELLDGILHAKGRILLYISGRDAQEVFEILCAIPFEHRTFPADIEPQRHPAIEAMIRQLKDRIEKEE